MKRPVVVLVASAAVVAAGLAPAMADSGSLGTSYAAAANVTPGTGIDPVVSTNGDIADLLDFLSPVLDQFVAPVTAALSALPTTMSSDLAADLDASYVANSSNAAQPAPADDTYPDCAADGWSADNCYTSDAITSAVNPVVSLSASSVRGFAAGDTTGSKSAAQTSGVTLSALGIDLGSLGTATSSAVCLPHGTCATTDAFSGANLLDGTIAAKSAADGSVLVSLNGADYQPASGLADGTTVTDGATTATVQSDGDALKISIPMTLDQLLTGLGVTDDLADYSAYDAGSTISLDVFVGGQSADSSNSRSSGLRVGIGVNADIEVSVFGLLGASVTVPDTNVGNVADLQLAFTTATAAPDESDATVDPGEQSELK